MVLRIGDLKDGLEPTIKSGLMSALGNFETRRVGLIEDRLVRRDWCYSFTLWIGLRHG